MSLPEDRGKILVLGIGNLLMGDEGIGVHVVQRFQAENEYPDVDVVDGGTGGFHLLELFQSYPHIVLIDATIDGKPPGEFQILRPRFSRDYPRTLVSHDIGLKDLLDSVELLGQSPEISLIAISINDIDQSSLALSPEVEEAIPEVIKSIHEVLQK